MAPFVGALESLKDRALGELSTRQLSSVCNRAALTVVFHPKWKQKEKVRDARQRELSRKDAERRVYEGKAPLHGGAKRREPKKTSKKADSPKKPKEPEYSTLTELEIDAIAKHRAAKDVLDAQKYSEMRELGLDERASDEAVLKKEMANAYYDVGEMIFASDADESVWGMLPVLHKRFSLIGSPEPRREELFRMLHAYGVPKIKAEVAAHYDFTLDGTNVRRTADERDAERDQLRERVEACVKDACRLALAALKKDEDQCRRDIDKLQRKLVKLQVKTPDLAVVPSWCQWTKARGHAYGKPLLVQRAALKVQLDAVKRDRAAKAPPKGRAPKLELSKSAPQKTYKHLAAFEPSWATSKDDESFWGDDDLEPAKRGYELERARQTSLKAKGDKLPAIGNFGSPSKAPKLAHGDDDGTRRPDARSTASASRPTDDFSHIIGKSDTGISYSGSTTTGGASRSFAEREADLADFVRDNGLADFLSPDKPPRPSPR